MEPGSQAPLQLTVDGRQVEVPDDGGTLLGALRDHLGMRSAKDGCSPQGQCGCCTVLVDGAPRVACVTPVRRVAGRAVTTVDGLADAGAWAAGFCATGASQCGFCTPGIAVRLSGLRASGAGPGDTPAVERALLAHLCRCTGWRPVFDAWRLVTGGVADVPGYDPMAGRDGAAAERRALVEGGVAQRMAPEVALGRAGFAADTAPAGTLVAVADGAGGWAVGETLAAARAAAGKVQGRRTTAHPVPPLDLPAPGSWACTLRTTWVEPAYLETDASWCEPGGDPASPLANGGAFGAKLDSRLPAAARALADTHGRAVLVLASREDCTRNGAKRPPVAAGIAADGTGAVRVARTPGVADRLSAVAPGWAIEEVDVAGPPTTLAVRAVGWAEVAVLRAGLAALTGDASAEVHVTDPTTGGVATAAVDPRDGTVRVRVEAGDPLDEVVLRSYCTGAAHQGLGWVATEGLAVDEAGQVHDLTVRSFGVLRAVDTPAIEVEVADGTGPPVRVGDAVFAAVAGAAWVARGCPPDLPAGGPTRPA